MARSELTIDLGAVRRNAKALLAALAGAELWAVVKADGYGHGAVDVADACARRGRDGRCASPPSPRRSCCGASSRTPASSSWARRRAARSRRRGRPARARRLRRRTAAGRGPSPPEARHRHGPLRALRAADAAARGRRADDAPRDRRLGPRVRRAADRALPRRDRAVPRLHPAHRQQRCRAAAARRRASTPPAAGSRSTGSRRSAAIRPTDGLEPALSWRSELAQVKLLERGREHRATAVAFVAEQPTWIGIVPGRLRGRLPARPDRDGGARRRRAPAGGRHDLDGLVRGRAAGRAAGRHACDAARRRRPRRGRTRASPGRSTTSSSAGSTRAPQRARRTVVDG